MAETLSYQEPQNVTSVDNLTPEEQDSLAVGESISQQEDQLYAGKYKSAEDLETAYLELQKKLGQTEQTEEAPEAQQEQPEEEQGEPTILDRIWEESTSREEFTPELTEEISKLSSTELANMYLDYRQANEGAEPQVNRDFSEADIKELKGIVGGEKNYSGNNGCFSCRQKTTMSETGGSQNE
mgnify:CR=1 FL=1